MNNNYADLNNIFSEELTIKSISEDIIFCKESDAERFSKELGYDSLLYINSDGKYVVYDNWKEPRTHLLEHNDVVSDSTSLIEAFDLIIKNRRVFIKSALRIEKIATMSDLSKVPFRIWMFGTISILEMSLRNIIKNKKQFNWGNSLSAGRLEQATKLYENKRKDNQEIDLLECVQIKDLCTIICKCDELFVDFGFNLSKTQFEKNFDNLNIIRDELSHSNQKFTLTWFEILEVLKFTDKLIQRIQDIS